MSNRSLTVLFVIVLLSPCICVADVIPSVLFTDHMVIQQDTEAPVWGTADAGEKITVSGSWGETASTAANSSGKWMLKLKTPPAGGPHTLTIAGNNTVEIKDVVAGEV